MSNYTMFYRYGKRARFYFYSTGAYGHLGVLLTICHLISNTRSWNNC